MTISDQQEQRREEERVTAEMPVRLPGAMGLTRNVSTSSVYFEIEGQLVAGSEISFEIEMDTDLGQMTMKCQGRVVRTEQKGTRMGIAVKMTDTQMEVRS